MIRICDKFDICFERIRHRNEIIIGKILFVGIADDFISDDVSRKIMCADIVLLNELIFFNYCFFRVTIAGSALISNIGNIGVGDFLIIQGRLNAVFYSGLVLNNIRIIAET